MTDSELRISAIIPARNEADCIAAVINGLKKLRSEQGTPLLHEIVVTDNGSIDRTASNALQAGAQVIEEPVAGYGQACWTAASVCRGNALLFVDGDGAADPRDALALIEALKDGADLVIGVRTNPDLGAMSLVQGFGNALACWLMRLIWRMPVSDLGPFRIIRREAFDRLDLRDRQYGWTVEMQVRAHAVGLVVTQVPVRWHVRSAGQSKISGTVRGVIGAGLGILGMIARLWWCERRRVQVSVPVRAPH